MFTRRHRSWSQREKGFPLQVSWCVRPKGAIVNIESIDKWFKDNVFDEDYAHGVRNPEVNPDPLSECGEESFQARHLLF